jgi:molybdate transport system substrate-binding protein
VLDNIVSYEEYVRAVLSKITLGAADGGIVYTSDLNGRAASHVGSLAIPKELSMVADYPIAPIINSDAAEVAQSFIAFVLSAQGQDLLRGFGFLPVNTSQ